MIIRFSQRTRSPIRSTAGTTFHISIAAAVKKLEQNDEFAPIRVSVFALTEERWNEFVDRTIDGHELKAAIAITNTKSVQIMITFEPRKVSPCVRIKR
jgi:hypothetical protein